MSRMSTQYILALGRPRARQKMAGVTQASHLPNSKRLNLRRFDEVSDGATNGLGQPRSARKKIPALNARRQESKSPASL